MNLRILNTAQMGVSQNGRSQKESKLQFIVLSIIRVWFKTYGTMGPKLGEVPQDGAPQLRLLVYKL